MAESMTTTLNKRWLTKNLVILAALFGFGCWGLYDAAYLYPMRGETYSADREREYLMRLALGTEPFKNASIADPVATRDQLASKRTELSDANADFTRKMASGSQADKMDAMVNLLPKAIDAARLDWLESLKTNWRLKPAYSTIENPAERLKTLLELQKTTNAPVPLSEYDLPIQWSFAGLGYGLAVVVGFNFLRTRAKRFTFEPDTRTLILPDKTRIAAADLAELDKRKWHKFYVTLVTKSGSEHEIDLYAYDPLEEWVLEMEKAAGLAKPDPSEPTEPSEPAASDAPSSEAAKSEPAATKDN